MRKPEQKVWDTFKRHIDSSAREVKYERVENIVSVGTPDVYTKPRHNVDTWIELKAPHAPVRDSSLLLSGSCIIRTEQRNWHHSHTVDYHGRSYILARDDKGELYLWHGSLALTLNGMSHKELREACIANTWAGIVNHLFGKRS